MKQAQFLRLGFLLGLLFNQEDGGNVSPKPRLTFNGLHDVTRQKAEHFEYRNVSIKSSPK
jgi:hypothetical protein